MKRLVIIPALNEEKNLPLLLDKIFFLKSPGLDILIVDDHSTDQTARLVEDASLAHPCVKLLNNPQSQHGLAHCYKAGFAYALANNYDIVITMDADLSHDPCDIPRLIDALGDVDWVVGSRYWPGGRDARPEIARVLFSVLANRYIETRLHLGLRDATSGFNCFKKKVLQGIDIPSVGSRGFVFQVEMKFLARKAGFILKEVPIEFHHRYAGRSKFSLRLVLEALFRLNNLKG